MSAKEMFEELGWSYDYVKGDCWEDTIQCKDLNKSLLATRPTELKTLQPDIQFNLMSKFIAINNSIFINIDILKAINKQAEELGWLDDRN